METIMMFEEQPGLFSWVTVGAYDQTRGQYEINLVARPNVYSYAYAFELIDLATFEDRQRRGLAQELRGAG